MQFFRSIEDARALFAHVRESQAFVDIHAWQFTPSSFRLVIHDLHRFGFIQLKEKAFLEGEGEFYLTLSRVGSGCADEPIELAKRAVREQAQIIA